MAEEQVRAEIGSDAPGNTSDGVRPLGGEPWDLAQLVAEHHEPLYRYAYRLSGSAADAEDLTQQVFLVAQQKIDQVRDDASVQGWLFTVLRNCYLRSTSRPTPLPIASLAVDFDLNQIPDETTPVEIDRETLQHAISELADEFKLVLLMFFFEHRSYREIAAALNIPTGTVMSRLSRAKSHLRQRLLANDEHETDTVNKVPGKSDEPTKRNRQPNRGPTELETHSPFEKPIGPLLSGGSGASRASRDR